MTEDDNDDSDRDGDKHWLAEERKKDSWFYSQTNQEGWEMMYYEGRWHIHSSFLIGKSDTESSMLGLNHEWRVFSDYCIDGRVSGT